LGNRLADFFRIAVNRIFSHWMNNPSSRSSPASLPPEKQNKRVFRRYPLEFDVSVTFAGPDTDRQSDQGELQDISGGGAMFRPCQPEKYYAGQQLETTIYLAGTNEVQGCVRSEATVVRVDGDDSPSANRPFRVAVRFDRTFDFERIDSSDAEIKE